jgi:hypothetical protein
MRKFYIMAGILLCTCFFIAYYKSVDRLPVATEERGPEQIKEENDEYDSPMERALLEFEKTKDPALGYVPFERLGVAMDYTEEMKEQLAMARGQSNLLWVERGPIFDSLGPSNGNGRAGVNYTSGRVRAILWDTLNDPTGNTVFAGGVNGGLWKCTNFLSTIPNWQSIDDYFDNLAIAYICQDPSNPSLMYFSTGEGTSNADAVLGRGIWKSSNAGTTWSHLPSTVSFIRSFRILCDNAGNVYAALRPTAAPVVQTSGLVRSSNGGATWTNITPMLVGTATATATCTDIEISSTGKLYASFGYATGAPGTTVRAYVTNNPATVTQSSGWTLGTGIRLSGVAAIRMELAAVADTVYAVTSNTAANTDSCYLSLDGGVTWTKRNSVVIPTGLGSGQTWYNQTLTINPRNIGELMSGGLDAYRSLDSGRTWTRATFWVTTAPYVHADHHFIQWCYKNNESRVLIGCDGGLFLSRDHGVTWADKNRNLAIKQFYSAAIHPDPGSPYLIGGTQDNGVHQLRYEGLGPSTEVTGGDGCFTHINQVNPSIQFGSYVFNQYRRSINGGQSWTNVNFSGTQGLFVNPFDYDDAQNIMYASNGVSATPNTQIRRWPNANTTAASTVISVPGLIKNGANSNATSFKVSPYTANRVFIGGSTGKLLRLDNANTVTAANIVANTTDITGASFPNGFLNCINTGSSDQVLIAVFTNFGINNVWYSTSGGTSWTAIDGNLPDMPVRWAIIVPGQDDQIILATEAGIYTTEQANGANTIWKPNPGYPTVRTDMLKLRASDNTVVAATHGRGLFTAAISMTTAPEIRFVTSTTAGEEHPAFQSGCRPYQEYTVRTGMINPGVGTATVKYQVIAGNSAQRGVDFDFTTNGNFESPSDEHVFPGGTTEVKVIKVRVYDDTEVEGQESFTLGFTISGHTTAIAGIPNTHLFTINDNGESVPQLSQTLIATIGVGNTALTQPFRAQFSDARTQIMYLASELKAAGFSAGKINSIAFNVISKNSTAPFNGFTIKMKNTLSSGTGFGTFEAGAVPVYGPVNYSTVAGINSFALTSEFIWDGSSNLLFDICYDNVTGTVTDNVAGTSGINLTHFNRIDSAAGCSLPAATFGFTGGARPDITFNITTFQTIVATALNTNKTEHLDSHNDLYYYSSAGEIIARIRNLTAHDYGCTQLVIDRAGTGATRFWNNNKKNYLADKTYRVSPAVGNATGRYEITLYYTKDEKEGWERATTNNWDQVQIVKTSGPVSEVTPSNAQPNNNGTVQTVGNPVRGVFGNSYTLTFTFENGFGGFGVGMPGRMNNVTVQAGPKGGGQTRTNTMADPNAPIEVRWTTDAEDGSSFFELEKSYDGIKFHKIATINAARNSTTEQQYSYTDKEEVEMNYYRVTLHHSDGRSITSNIAFVKKQITVQKMIVMTNPFRDEIAVRFAKLPVGPVTLNLYDLQGRLVKAYKAGASQNAVMRLNGEKLAAGIYTVEAFIDGKRYTEKLARQ